MRSVTFSMTLSADGYIADPDGDFSWSVPDDELHRFHNERVRDVGVHLLGRRLYETMVFWESVDPDGDEDQTMREFAAIWQPLPKIVFSSTLTAVEGNTRLADGSVAETIAELRADESITGDIAVGGAVLAAEAARHDLIDEYELFVAPVVIGGGTPFFAAGAPRADLELVETRTFGQGVVYLHYRRV